MTTPKKTNHEARRIGPDQTPAGTLVELALRHWREAFGLALSYCGNRARAEDLCQEAFLRLCRRRGSLDSRGGLRGYLLAIVRNLARDESKKRVASSLESGAPVSGEGREWVLVDESPGPGEVLDRREERSRVEEALEGLASSWRAMLYLRDGLGLPYREIASIVGTTEGAVRVTLHRARERVRSILEKSMGPESST